jgi:hypothetical protein
MKTILLAKLALVSCVAFALTLAACARHGLQAIIDDGGSPPSGPDTQVAARDLPTEPPVEAPDVAIREMGPDREPGVGPDAAREHGPEARAEVGLDSRDAGVESRQETGTEGTSEVALDVGSETRPEVPPDVAWDLPPESPLDGGPSGCPAWTSTITLAELEWLPLPSDLLVHGDTVYLGVAQTGTAETPPAGAIIAVSIPTGEATTFSLGSSLPGWIAAGSDALFYIQGKGTPAGGDSWRFEYPDVARLDLVTGQTSVVDSELVPYGYTILSVVGNARDEVFWSMLDNPNASTSVIRRWDQATRSVQTVREVEQAAALLADSDHLYWSGPNSAGRMAFFSASTTGESVSQIQEWSSDVTDFHDLVAVDGQSLYYTRPGSTARGIFAMPKGGGDSRTVVANADPMVIGSQTIDDTHVYWIDARDQQNIRRAPKTGDDAMETIATGETGQITELAVDGCNVYWLASGKPRLLAHSK